MGGESRGVWTDGGDRTTPGPRRMLVAWGRARRSRVVPPPGDREPAARRGLPSPRPHEQRLRGAARAARLVGRAPPRRARRRACPAASTASRQTHSPAGSRVRCTVSSVLMKRWRRKSSAALTPLPESAATSTRASGVTGSPATSGWRMRIQTARRAGLEERPARGSGSPSRCGSRPPGPSGRTGAPRRASGPGGGGSSGTTTGSRIAAQPPRGRARDLARRRRRAAAPAPSSTLRPGRRTRRRGQRRERDRAQDLDRDPPDEPAVALERGAEQRGRRAGVLRAGVPRAAGQLGRVQDSPSRGARR